MFIHLYIKFDDLVALKLGHEANVYVKENKPLNSFHISLDLEKYKIYFDETNRPEKAKRIPDPQDRV